MIPSKVLDDLQVERTYQLERGAKDKLPGRTGWSYGFDDKNTANDWAAYCTIYLGKAVATAEAGVTSAANFRKHMVKVATLACAAIEAVDRTGELPPRHYDH